MPILDAVRWWTVVGAQPIGRLHTSKIANGAELQVSAATVPFTVGGEPWFCSVIHFALIHSTSDVMLSQRLLITSSLSEMVADGH